MNIPDSIFKIAIIAITLIFWNTITYHLGWVTIFISTLGKYPEKELTEKQKGRVITVGFFVLAVILAVFVYLNNRR